MAKLVLTREQIREIVFIDANNAYGKGKRKEAGKTYSRYQYFPDGADKAMVFTVEDTNPFTKLFGTGKLETVTLNTTTSTRTVTTVDDKGVEKTEEVTSPALEFITCISSDAVDTEDDILYARQEKAIAREVKLQALREALKAELKPETLNAILQGAV